MKDGEADLSTPATRAGAKVSPAAVRMAEAIAAGGAWRRRIVGTVFVRPWFDGVTLSALKHLFFPASRLLAAADEARGDPVAFLRAVPLSDRRSPSRRLARLLARIEQARATSSAIDARWDEVFFAGRAVDDVEAVTLEAARIRARHDLNAMRWRLRALMPTGVKPVRLALETPAAVATRLDPVLGPGLFEATAAGEPEVAVSRPVATAAGIDYWLRFKSPSSHAGDVVTARVHEPRGVIDPPTLVFGHGVCVDFDHWLGLIDESVGLVSHGFRVIRPEAPWHGRRTPRGSFAGERTVATFPAGIVDSMRAAVAEWGVLARWARTQSRGPLAFGGSSLGAMTAQLAAGIHKVDGLLLVTHTADMTAVALDGALATLWADPADYARLGWTPELARRYLSHLDAPAVCPVPPGKLVSVIGRRDTVLPFRSGRDRLAQWGVPEANIFAWDRGHFTVPATMIRTRAPLQQFVRVLTA